MIVTLSGAQGVGKTTLLNEMRNSREFALFEFVDEVVRTLMKFGIKINEMGDAETQMAVMQAHIDNARLPVANLVLDRCALDCHCYSIYLYRRGKISDEIFEISKISMIRELSNYDVMFYIAPEFDIVPDGVRATDVSFRDEIAEIFEEVIELYGIEVIRLTGTVENRMKTILDALR